MLSVYSTAGGMMVSSELCSAWTDHRSWQSEFDKWGFRNFTLYFPAVVHVIEPSSPIAKVQGWIEDFPCGYGEHACTQYSIEGSVLVCTGWKVGPRIVWTSNGISVHFSWAVPEEGTIGWARDLIFSTSTASLSGTVEVFPTLQFGYEVTFNYATNSTWWNYWFVDLETGECFWHLAGPQWRPFTPPLPASYTLWQNSKVVPSINPLRYLPKKFSDDPLFYNAFVRASEYHDPFWKGDLCDTAIQDCKVIDINSLMYLTEVANIGEHISSELSAYASTLLDPSAQNAASAYLSNTYGMQLTASDTQELSSALWREISRVRHDISIVRARRTLDVSVPNDPFFGSEPLEIRRCCKIRYRPHDNAMLNALQHLIEWDLWPELENVWDFIPYSFAVDWLVPFGDLFGKLDRRTYSNTLQVLQVLYSQRFQRNIPTNYLGRWLGYTDDDIHGSATVKYYSRWSESRLSYPTLALTGNNFNHWLEAGSLIIQRL